MIESVYENEDNSKPQQLRAQAYWTILSGGMGHIFGNCPIWHFGSDGGWCGSVNWKGALDSPGSMSMFYMQKLFRSRPWFSADPDIEHVAMIAGYGSWGNTNYVTTARMGNNSTLIAYLPDSTTVTIDMSAITGVSARSWWYNPANGEAIEIGLSMTTGQLDFTPPSNGDWVLVIDDASLELPAPGSFVYLSINRTSETEEVVPVIKNHPNPLNNYTRFEYNVSKPSKVTLTIYNLLGQKVRVLRDGNENTGKKIVDWDGTDNYRHELSSGTYVYVLEIGKQRFSRKLLILK